MKASSSEQEHVSDATAHVVTLKRRLSGERLRTDVLSG